MIIGTFFLSERVQASCTCVYPSGTLTNQASCPDPHPYSFTAVDCTVTPGLGACDFEQCTGTDCIVGSTACATTNGVPTAYRISYSCGNHGVAGSESLTSSTCGTPTPTPTPTPSGVCNCVYPSQTLTNQASCAPTITLPLDCTISGGGPNPPNNNCWSFYTCGGLDCACNPNTVCNNNGSPAVTQTCSCNPQRTESLVSPACPVSSPGSATLTVQSLDFGDLQTSDSSTRFVTVLNTSTVGGTSCSVSSLSNTSDFSGGSGGTCTSLTTSGSSSSTFNLAASSNCTLQYTGQPSSTSPSSKTSTFSVSCAGPSAVSAPGALQEKGVVLPTLFVDSPTYSFGALTQGLPSAPISVHVYTTGNLDSTGCGVTSSDPQFSVQNVDCSSTLTGGGSCFYKLVATPASSAAGSATLTLSCTAVSSTNPAYQAPPSSKMTSLYTFTSSAVPTVTVGICPSGYDMTAVDGIGTQDCRPVVPSLDFFRSGTSAYSQGGTPTSGGYPACGLNRIAIALDYGATQVSGFGTPQSASSVKNALGNPQFWFATGTDGASPANPVYLYSDPTYKMSRCQCTDGSVAAQPTATQGPVSLLLPLTATTPSANTANNPNGVRFFPDDYETVRAQSTVTVADIPHAMVAIPVDGVSNGSMGDIYLSGQSFCGCPNLNEKPLRIDPLEFSGDICQSMMDFADAPTKKYAVLTTFFPGIHQNGATSQIFSAVEPFSTSSPSEYLTKIKLPTVNGGYQQYNRRIWTCAPPMVPKFVSASKIQCQFPQTNHACDNGSGGGPPSVVSKKWNTTFSPTAAFDNIVNKKLACCLNDFNPQDLTKAQKFDCVDNSSPATPYASFDALWTGQDSAADGGQPYALALTNSSGQVVTGFYGLDGERCNEFSEFGGQRIQSTTVNPLLMSSQQTSVGDSNAIQTNSYSVSPNSSTVSAFAPIGKRIPANAAEMRRCPILVRAAMIAKCPDPIALPKALVSYPVTSSAGVIPHCSVASTVEIHLRVEQIYEITGLPKMKIVDSLLEGVHPANVDVMSLIKSKTNGFCPGGSILTEDGSCTYQ